jgi:hypothetical protein
MRKDWVNLRECCEEALVLFPQVEEDCVGELAEAKVLIMLADAAEGQGDMGRAHEYDEKAKKGWRKYGEMVYIPQLTACHRRDAIEFPKAGRAYEAGCALKYVPDIYVNWLERGINFTEIVYLETLLAALKVLADALEQTGNPQYVFNGGQIRADVEETEAVLAGYWEGVLEETRWELAEQRRAAERGAGGEREKKSKAAKRKQQKRKAQQQKKAAAAAAAAVAAAATAAAAARGEEVTQRQEGDGEQALQEQGEHAKQAQQEQQKEKEQQKEEQKGEEEEKGGGKGGIQRVVTGTTAALSAVAISGTKEEEEEEEEENQEEECSVCLNVIESDDADHPVGPPLLCGHRYHAFCLSFWVEKCRSKCIEATCPYCRSPLPEMGSN